MIDYKTEEELIEIVKTFGEKIKYIHNPSEAVKMAAVKKDGHTIQYIHNPSEAVQMAAVKQDGYSIQYIHNPSEAVQMAAVKQDGYAIKFIHNPSEAVQRVAIKQGIDLTDRAYWKYAKNPEPAFTHIYIGSEEIRYSNESKATACLYMMHRILNPEKISDRETLIRALEAIIKIEENAND